MSKIVVGMDTSEAATTALHWAVREAELRSATVTAVMVWTYLDQAHAGPGGRFDPDYSQSVVSTVLDNLLEEELGPDAASEIEQLVVCDLPARGLLDAAEGADLIVVGARGLGGFKALMLGSVSEQVLHHAPCPVAVIREHATDPAGAEEAAGQPRIVVGIDGSTNGQEALHWALDEARLRQAQLELVHAWRSPLVGFGPGSVVLDPETMDADARKLLQEALDREDTTSLAAPVQFTTRSGSPAGVLLEAAEGADLIVTGSRGLGGFKGLLLGATSHQVARHATSPLVVVPVSDSD